MRYDWRAIGITLPSGRSGDVKTVCPQCSSERTHKRDKCLSANTSTGLFLCHHCTWKGKAPEIGMATQVFRPAKKTFTRPSWHPGAEPQDKLIAWFQTRGISESVVRRNRIETRQVFMPDSGKEERAIAFPYYRGEELVNVQYRTHDKRFRLEAGCELILYGLNDIQPGEPLIVVEGQMDKLSLEEAGYKNCVSVPNGANGGNLGEAEWLSSAQVLLDAVQYFILAGDNDQPGRLLMDELSRRLGPEKCWRVEWPEGCKDANDVLVKMGKPRLIEAIETAQPLPIEGIIEIRDMAPEMADLYEVGVQPGAHTGWANLSRLYRPRLGEWTMVTGAPSMGKSSFLDAMLLNLALGENWKFAMFSPEQAPLKRHVAQLVEIYQGKPFSIGPTPRMSWAECQEAMGVLGDYFKFIEPHEDDLSVDGILSLVKACVTRYGINSFVVDPWNELEHNRPSHKTETEYISESLTKLRRFTRLYNLHMFILVHPTKLKKDEKTGGYPVASPYDANGSAHWFNKADAILSVWRDKAVKDSPLEVHVQKIRFRENGELGVAKLQYDFVTGRLHDIETIGFASDGASPNPEFYQWSE